MHALVVCFRALAVAAEAACGVGGARSPKSASLSPCQARSAKLLQAEEPQLPCTGSHAGFNFGAVPMPPNVAWRHGLLALAARRAILVVGLTAW